MALSPDLARMADRAMPTDENSWRWANSQYGGPNHLVGVEDPASWQTSWFHQSACGMTPPRGGWKTGNPEAPYCRMCEHVACTRLGFIPRRLNPLPAG